MPNVYTIAPDLPFADTVIDRILEQFVTTPSDLATLTVLLPNRRSCQSFKRAFLNRTNHSATILPKLLPLGELGELMPTATPNLDPAMPRTEQRILMTQLVAHWMRDSMDIAHAAELAFELLSLLDNLTEEECDLSQLHNIIPDHYSHHWQLTLNFLKLITDEWPALLKKLKLSDPMSYRTEALHAQRRHWDQHPPTHPIIAAGSTGSIPATAQLLTTLAHCDHGYVILPGLDQQLPQEDWEAIEPTHPQYALKQLLEQMGMDRHAVKSWGTSTHSDRTALIREAMRPAHTTHHWQKTAPLPSHSTARITRIDAATLHEEARVIALILRENLTHKDRTAALVTSDRTLARYVQNMMAQWNITLDDSEGIAIAQTPPAIFMRLLFDAALPDASPVTILSFLKHPLCLGQEADSAFRYHVRMLEKSLFRGVRHHNTLHAIAQITQDSELGHWFEGVLQPLLPLIEHLKQPSISLNETLKLHIQCCEALSQEGAIWQSDQGRQLQSQLEEIMCYADHLSTIRPTEYHALLCTLLSGTQYRPSYGQNPRLHILSPIEARMQRYDTLILAGLNEGTWPESPGHDPWMNRSIRAQMQLAPMERVIGLSAHDFAQLFAQNQQLYLTRCQKHAGTHTIASRWLLRLEQVMLLHQLQYDASKPWLHWARNWHTPKTLTPCLPPTPSPDATMRPTRYSASMVEKLMRNPYHIYASRILRLKPLDPIDQDPGAAEFGNFIHQVLEIFRRDAHPLTYDALISVAQEQLRALALPRAIITVWWPRFENIARWIIAQEIKRQDTTLATHTENNGHYEIGAITIAARADRIDERHDGTLEIIDYKTGTLPSRKSIELGLSPQMLVEALIAQKGGYALSTTLLGSVNYWKLSGGYPAGEIQRLNFTKEIYEAAESGIAELGSVFMKSTTPYLYCPRPHYAPAYDEYAHLAREQEWRN